MFSKHFQRTSILSRSSLIKVKGDAKNLGWVWGEVFIVIITIFSERGTQRALNSYLSDWGRHWEVEFLSWWAIPKASLCQCCSRWTTVQKGTSALEAASKFLSISHYILFWEKGINSQKIVLVYMFRCRTTTTICFTWGPCLGFLKLFVSNRETMQI